MLTAIAAKHAIDVHNLRPDEVAAAQRALIEWYDQNKRDLPWRALDGTQQERAYRVWVSETMCQQTRVATVIPYWTRWMARFPTVAALANATLEEVNESWSGLGYYRRARYLHDGAKHVVEKLDGMIPNTAKALQALPGIGPYTAGAIASIVFGEEAPLVDGNVVRVTSRLRGIAGDPTDKAHTAQHWKLARALVTGCGNASALNQALMELGATLCTPKGPLCDQCPVRHLCCALAEEKGAPPPARNDVEDVEDCTLCAGSERVGTGPTAYPGKKKKAKQRLQTCVAAVLELPGRQYVMMQRPADGLLANLFEFPLVVTSDDEHQRDMSDDERRAALAAHLQAHGLAHFVDSAAVASRRSLGHVEHTFSHIQQLVLVEHVVLRDALALPTGGTTAVRLAAHGAVGSMAVSRTTLKIVELLEAQRAQPGIATFFAKKPRK